MPTLLPGKSRTAVSQPAAASKGRGRLSSRLLRGGTEPDPRFTLANERTFLAWIRTSLALLAGGVAVEAFMSGPLAPDLRKAISLLLLLLALVIGGGSFFRWLNVERSMRHKQPLPLPWIAPVLAIGGAAVAGTMISFVIRG
ncbi:YidH family protein [Paenarthrobacter ureafaciens]|uniref:YidH family protein n=1 Tax=Paenarthrobacter ureafaciens TaxID=37931 RepID=UPI001C2BFD68|nr:DUF202 domain-containing protein [Paenarthrobacter ureafaciens]